eukprot:478905_1
MSCSRPLKQDSDDVVAVVDDISITQENDHVLVCNVEANDESDDRNHQCNCVHCPTTNDAFHRTKRARTPHVYPHVHTIVYCVQSFFVYIVSCFCTFDTPNMFQISSYYSFDANIDPLSGKCNDSLHAECNDNVPCSRLNIDTMRNDTEIALCCGFDSAYIYLECIEKVHSYLRIRTMQLYSKRDRIGDALLNSNVDPQTGNTNSLNSDRNTHCNTVGDHNKRGKKRSHNSATIDSNGNEQTSHHRYNLQKETINRTFSVT